MGVRHRLRRADHTGQRTTSMCWCSTPGLFQYRRAVLRDPTGAGRRGSGKKTAKKTSVDGSPTGTLRGPGRHGADPSVPESDHEAESYPPLHHHHLLVLHQPRIKTDGGRPGMKRAVECGYWHLTVRPAPRSAERTLYARLKEPDWSGFGAFLSGESRYAMLGGSR